MGKQLIEYDQYTWMALYGVITALSQNFYLIGLSCSGLFIFFSVTHVPFLHKLIFASQDLSQF